jgi:aminopeptidase N
MYYKPLYIILVFSCMTVFSGCAVRPSGPAREVVQDTIAIEDDLAIRRSRFSPRGAYNPERTKVFDLVHTKLQVSFDWQKQHLLGLATVTLRPWFYAQDTLRLDARGFDIHAVNMVGQGGAQPLWYRYDSEVITMALGRTYNRTENVTVEIDYTAKPNELPEGGSAAITSDKGLYFINPLGNDPNKPRQIWTQGETQANSAWFPTIDSPNQRCTQEMYITVDTNFTTLSNGTLVYSRTNKGGTRTDYWEQKLPHAPYLFMMAVGEFAIVKDSWEGMEVNYYVEPPYAQHAKAVFGNTPEMLTFFSNRLGVRYPWAKYSQIVVRDYVSGAMENTTASVFMEALQIDDREILDTDWDYIIAHELFHQWFGDLVTTESWANLPLNEAFANYSEYLWAEYKKGRLEADHHNMVERMQYLDEAQTKQVPLIRYYYTNREDMFDSHSYAKGGRVLHMLRKYVGDEAFFESLKVYLTQNKFKDVEVHNLRLAFEEVTGQDLNWFFNQWFMEGGHPELQVEHTYTGNQLQLTVRQVQDTSLAPTYKMPLDVEVWVNDQKRIFPIVVDKNRQSFTFDLPSAPQAVVFDAEQQLLAVIEHNKSVEEYIEQYKRSDKFQARFDALNALEAHMERAEVENTILIALNDSSDHIREHALDLLAKMEPDRFETVRNRIMQIAIRDPKSTVRATAVQLLGANPDAASMEIFARAMQDRSYLVAASGLSAYLEHAGDEGDKLKAINQFKELTNKNVIAVVADYFSSAGQGSPEAYNWFVHKLQGAQPEIKYYMLQYLGKYLLNANPQEQEKGAKVLEEIARNDANYIARFGAYQALSLLVDMEGVEDIRKDIRDKEQDPKVIRLFNMIP